MQQRRRIHNPLPETFERKVGTKNIEYKLSSHHGNEACYLDDFGEFHYFSVIRLRDYLKLPEFAWEGEDVT